LVDDPQDSETIRVLTDFWACGLILSLSEPRVEPTYMGDENLPEDDIAYQDLETAAFHNNKDFILLWLQNADYKKNKNFNKWSSDLLRRAAYLHSVDVVECIVSYGGHCAV